VFKLAKIYVRYVDAVSRVAGRLTMYFLLFAMMVVLLYGCLAGPLFDSYPIWTVEVAQFAMAAYYLLGGGYSMILDGHVRMDVLYSRWSEKTRAKIDVITAVCLIVYLVVLLLGGLSSVDYALTYNQKNYTPWAPPLAPIKIIMTIGILLMLLQAIAILIRDIATARGETIT
jgi:TRAP-type mannitol/chloroaromatic compound transport system permease small subunit